MFIMPCNHRSSSCQYTNTKIKSGELQFNLLFTSSSQRACSALPQNINNKECHIQHSMHAQDIGCDNNQAAVVGTQQDRARGGGGGLAAWQIQLAGVTNASKQHTGKRKNSLCSWPLTKKLGRWRIAFVLSAVMLSNLPGCSRRRAATLSMT